MTASHDAAAKRKHAGSRLDALLGALTCVLLTALTLSASAAGVSVNATAYANNDITVNTINSGLMVMMIANAQPSAFNPRTFVVKAYPLYAAADGAIVSMNNVIIVNWCAKKTNELNSSMSCADGRELNNVTYPYVLIQMRFPAWAGSKLAEPSLVDLSSLNVVKQLAVKSLPGIYDPDTNKTSGGLGYLLQHRGRLRCLWRSPGHCGDRARCHDCVRLQNGQEDGHRQQEHHRQSHQHAAL